MLRITRIGLACVAFATLLLPLAPSHATTVVALSDGELAKGARTILHGDVVGRASKVDPATGRIYTEYRFAAREVLKGAAAPDGSVTFREWGGEVNGVRYWVPGVSGYVEGEEVVAFLGDEDARTKVGFTFGLAQGKYTVERDAAKENPRVRRKLGDLTVLPRPGAPAPAAESPARDLEAFKAEIRAEVRK